MIAKGSNTATIANVNTLTARSRSNGRTGYQFSEVSHWSNVSGRTPGLRGNLRPLDLQPSHHLRFLLSTVA
jgi:hypothetical protein